MAIWNWTDMSGGMSDDSFLGRKGEFLDCENVDIVNNVRYVQGKAQVGLPTELGTSVGEEVNVVRDGIYPAFATTNHTFIGGFDTTTESAGAYQIEQIGTSSLPVTFFFQNGAIKQVKFDGGASTLVGTITTNVPSGVPTATCVGAGRIYYGVANKIYTLLTNSVDPTTTICVMHGTDSLNTIPFGFTIKFIYIYNDIMTIVATSSDSTYIYQCTETSTAEEWQINYFHKVSGVLAIGATGENNNVYWFSSESLYQTNGTESQKIKVIGKDEGATSFSTDAVMTIRDSIVYIADGLTVYEFGSVKPGYNKVLTKHTKKIPVTAINGDIVVYYSSSKAYWERLSNQDLFDNWSVTSLPYEAGMFNQPKTGTALRVGHILPKYSTYSSATTLASLEIGVITDEMEHNGASPIVVRTITTPTTGVADRYTDISVGEINDALIGYSTDFQYVKLVVTGNGGDPSNVIGFGTYYNLTPKFFGINLVHNEIKKGIPN